MVTSVTDANSARIRVEDVVTGLTFSLFPHLLHLFESVEPYELCVLRNGYVYELNGMKCWVMTGLGHWGDD
jgi:hypothetical protein